MSFDHHHRQSVGTATSNGNSCSRWNLLKVKSKSGVSSLLSKLLLGLQMIYKVSGLQSVSQSGSTRRCSCVMHVQFELNGFSRFNLKQWNIKSCSAFECVTPDSVRWKWNWITRISFTFCIFACLLNSNRVRSCCHGRFQSSHLN